MLICLAALGGFDECYVVLRKEFVILPVRFGNDALVYGNGKPVPRIREQLDKQLFKRIVAWNNLFLVVD